uniref:Protein big brother-like n=1 Tax=Dermatophagoides pteronyssinus TaxID=6956 RepID=A0A6P6Y1J1_DERPT|nr:protein big brother-like [Dermatophagoides pteronyssinus]
MLPFETPTIFEQLPRFIFQMPRVVTDQKAKFENDELFRKLSRESEIRYTGYRDRPLEERQIRFINGCREGHTDIAFVSTGTNLQLLFNPLANAFTGNDYCDFDKEKGKVHIRSSMIIDGVCIRWRGYIDLERLDGIGCLEYDEDRGRIEDAILRQQIEQYKLRMREFEERQRLYKLAQAEHQKKNNSNAHNANNNNNATAAAAMVTSATTTMTTTATATITSTTTTTLATTTPPVNLSKGELRKYHIENILSGNMSNHNNNNNNHHPVHHGHHNHHRNHNHHHNHNHPENHHHHPHSRIIIVNK